MAVEVEPVRMGHAMPPAGVHRFGDSGAFPAATTTTLLAERDAHPGTAVASLLVPSRAIVTLRPRARTRDR